MKLALIRIKGQVGLDTDIVETLHRLRLRRKYICVVLENPSKEQLGMVKKVTDFIAFGEISDDVYKELVKKRGQKDSKGNLKPFFRMHPPRKGIESKKHFGVDKGVLGNHKNQINKLIERML